MNVKATLILLIVFAIAAIGLLLVDTGSRPSTDEPDKSQPQQLIVDPDTLGPQLVQLTIDLDGEDGDLVLARVQGQWKIESPHAFPARTSELDKVLRTLAELEGKPIDDVAISSQPIGLTIGHGEKRTSLWLGKRIGSGKAVIYRESEARLQGYLATDKLHDMIVGLSPNLFYAESFDPLLMAEIREIRITTPESEAVLRQAEDNWRIAYGDKSERALTHNIPEHYGVKSYFELFRNIELVEQQPYQSKQGLSKFGLDKPLIAVRFVPTLEDAGNTNRGWLLKVGVPADPDDQTRFVSFGWSGDPTPAVFTVATPYALSFAKDPTVFRDPRVVRTPSKLIASIGLQFTDRPQATIELAAGTEPQLRKSNGQTIALSVDHVVRAIKQLVDVRSMDFVPAKFSESDRLVSAVITPKLDIGAEAFAVYIDPESKADGPTVLVHRGEEPVVMRVQRAVVAELIDPSTLLAKDGE